MAGPAEISLAVDAAETAYTSWRGWQPAERRNALFRLAQLIKENNDEFCRLAVLDNGVTYSFAGFGPWIAEEWTVYYAGWADKLEGELISSHRQQRDLAYTLAEPYGVVGIIITWNHPLISLAMKVARDRAGNTVVVKPSEYPVRRRALHEAGERGRHPGRSREHGARWSRGGSGTRERPPVKKIASPVAPRPRATS